MFVLAHYHHNLLQPQSRLTVQKGEILSDKMIPISISFEMAGGWVERKKNNGATGDTKQVIFISKRYNTNKKRVTKKRTIWEKIDRDLTEIWDPYSVIEYQQNSLIKHKTATRKPNRFISREMFNLFFFCCVRFVSIDGFEFECVKTE